MLTDSRIRSEDEFREHFLKNIQPREEYEVEVHYNHYGDRGVVDAVDYVQKQKRGIRSALFREAKLVYEFKYNLGDPKDLTKQFNRHKKFFKQGSEYRGRPSFSLVVYPSSNNWSKLQRFRESYPEEVLFYFPELEKWVAEKAIKKYKRNGVKESAFSDTTHIFEKLGIETSELEIQEEEDEKRNSTPKEKEQDFDKEVVKQLTREGCIVPKEAARKLDQELVNRIKSLESTPMYVSEAMLETLRKEPEVVV